MLRKANLGLDANLNLLVVYDPLWPAAFEDEKARLEKALGPVAKGIERSDAGLRETYAQEKKRAAAAAPGNRAAYNLQKGPFIAEFIQQLSGDRTA